MKHHDDSQGHSQITHFRCPLPIPLHSPGNVVLPEYFWRSLIQYFLPKASVTLHWICLSCHIPGAYRCLLRSLRVGQLTPGPSCALWLKNTRVSPEWCSSGDSVCKSKGCSSIPSQGTCLGCGPGPQWGPHKKQPHTDVSLPLFLPSLPPL